ncbi:MAG: hypothetical protein AAB408_02560, partial [Patescibacteria group bacterium]
VYHSAVQVITDKLEVTATAVVPEGSSYYVVNIEEPKKVEEVSALPVEAVVGDDFVTWNKDQDSADSKFVKQLGVLADPVKLAMAEDLVVAEIQTEAKEEAKQEVKDYKKEIYSGTPGESSVSSITLVADSPEAGRVSWTVNGNLATGMERGIRVLFSKNPNPTYGSNYALPVGWKNYAKIYPKDGDGTYYVRACEFLGDRCGTYSNEVTITVRGQGENNEYFDKTSGEWKSNRTGTGVSTVTSITLTANDPAPEHVSWTIGGSITRGMDRGMRVLFSRSPNPTLGTARALPVGYKRYTKIWPKDGAGTYYVRVCEYLGNNTCGTYSNEITVSVGESGTTGGEYKGPRMSEYKY